LVSEIRCGLAGRLGEVLSGRCVTDCSRGTDQIRARAVTPRGGTDRVAQITSLPPHPRQQDGQFSRYFTDPPDLGGPSRPGYQSDISPAVPLHGTAGYLKVQGSLLLAHQEILDVAGAGVAGPADDEGKPVLSG
jgi:hypothetical protein